MPMTTTQLTPDLAISTGAATREDAQLMLQLAALAQNDSTDRGLAILWASKEPMSLAEFETAHPIGSQGNTDVISVIRWYETVGTLVKQGLLNRGLVYDWLWVVGVWKKCEGIALGQREASGVVRLWENFEALAAGQPT